MEEEQPLTLTGKGWPARKRQEPHITWEPGQQSCLYLYPQMYGSNTAQRLSKQSESITSDEQGQRRSHLCYTSTTRNNTRFTEICINCKSWAQNTLNHHHHHHHHHIIHYILSTLWRVFTLIYLKQTEFLGYTVLQLLLLLLCIRAGFVIAPLLLSLHVNKLNWFIQLLREEKRARFILRQSSHKR